MTNRGSLSLMVLRRHVRRIRLLEIEVIRVVRRRRVESEMLRRVLLRRRVKCEVPFRRNIDAGMQLL